MQVATVTSNEFIHQEKMSRQSFISSNLEPSLPVIIGLEN